MERIPTAGGANSFFCPVAVYAPTLPSATPRTSNESKSVEQKLFGPYTRGSSPCETATSALIASAPLWNDKFKFDVGKGVGGGRGREYF